MTTKFKNNFVVGGQASLLNALKEEAITLGWKHIDRPHIRNIYFNGNRGGITLEPGEFWMSDGAKPDLTLPEDWDKAIQMLSEKIEEYEEGEWLYSVEKDNSNNYNIFRYGSIDGHRYYSGEGYNIINENVTTFKGSRQPYVSDITSHVRKASPEEIGDILIRVAQYKGFHHGAKFMGVRDMEVNEKYTEGKYITKKNSKESGMIGSKFWYNLETDILINWGYGGYVVYEKGVWATLKKEEQKPELSFGGRYVEVLPENLVEFSSCYVGTISEIQAVYNWHYPSLNIAGYPFKPWEKTGDKKNLPVTIGCTTGTLEELKAILDRYKEISSSTTGKN